MTPDQHRRVRELFEAAIERDEPDARAWVEREAHDDPDVRAEVLSLLDHHSRAGKFLDDEIATIIVPDLLLEEEPLAPGTKLGSYTILRELGRGGMGHVYLATEERVDRQVALKALPPRLVRDPRQRERLRREARAAGKLTHPGICTVYALEEIDGSLYIASEFVDGRTLREEIRSGSPPSPGELLQTARELADALAAAHRAGVIHRDLKPENIMRTTDGRLKILDFGLARMDQPDGAAGVFRSMPGVVIGTPAYMAPEQLKGEPADARTDVYAFGVVMYELSTGRHPFETGGPSSGDGSARGVVDEVVRRCMRTAPAERYASAIELADVLRRTDAPRSSAGRHTTWWRVHQIAIVVLYFASVVAAWRVKERVDMPMTLGLFLALSAVATVGGVLRGHLLFTERINPAGFRRELGRRIRALKILDVIVAVLMAAAAIAIARRSAVFAALTIGLGLGVGVAALVLEPSRTAAALGEDS